LFNKRIYFAITIISEKLVIDETKINFVEEWKTATETSQKFDEFLVDLRKYGFTILTGLITAGSFLGFSFSEQPTADLIKSSLLHFGVIYVTLLLVVILFWLDVYYQNLLYGSVLRCRFLEFFRLGYRLSVYISGLYTGSRMNNVLYSMYFGFLIGVFIMGVIVAAIIDQGTFTKGSRGILNQSGFQILLVIFALCLVAMGYIIYTGILGRKKKLETIMELFQEYLNVPKESLTNDKIIELENKITNHFPFEV
jgi:hypothetical protein